MADSAFRAIRLSEEFRQALLARDAAAAGRLIRAYVPIYQSLQDRVAGLLAEFGGQGLTAGQVQRLARYRRLLRDLEREMNRYTAFVESELRLMVAEAVTQAVDDAYRFVQATLPLDLDAATVVMSGVWNRLDAGTVESALGFFSPGSPLVERLSLLAPGAVERIAGVIVEGIALGLNPRVVARNIRREAGLLLSSALRHARTTQLWAYREASRAAWAENQPLVSGWVWYAQLGDPRTCTSCIAMHGTRHSVDEPLDDHWNGRCRPLPVVDWSVAGVDLPPLDYGPTGEEWLESLSEAEQRSILGPGRFKAWQAGVPLERFSREVEDAVWGRMRVETAIRDLLEEVA